MAKIIDATKLQGISDHSPDTADGRQSDVHYRFDLVDPKAMLAMAHIMHGGAKKGRTQDDWKSLTAETHLNHALGHIYAYLAGVDDSDHLAKAMTRCMMAWSIVANDLSEDMDQTKNLMVYLAHPCAGSPAENVAKMKKLVAHFQALYPEIIFIVPHLMFPQYSDRDAGARATVLDKCCQLVTMCDQLWICGKTITEGMKCEIEVATQHNLFIQHMSDAGRKVK